jgi:hypothetical protein
MNRQDSDKWLDEALTDVIGSQKPRTDFARWKTDHPDAVKMLTSRAGRKISAALRPLSIRSIIMRSPIARLSAAAAVIIACVIGLSLWRGTESGIALADVLGRVEKVKSVRYQSIYKVTGRDPNTCKPYNETCTSLQSQEYGLKCSTETLDPNGEWYQLSERYFLPRKKTNIVIYPTKKIYGRIELTDFEAEGALEQNLARDPFMIFKGILQTKFESLGKSTMDGVEVAGFRYTDSNLWEGKNHRFDIRIWVDVKTLLPVRFERVSNSFDKMGHEENQQYVMKDFQWDVPVDAGDFERPVPEGYTAKVIKSPPNSEEVVVQGLKLFVELLDEYPEKIGTIDEVVELAKKSKTPAALRLKEEMKEPEEKEEIRGFAIDQTFAKLADFLMPIRGVRSFYFLLDKNKKDPAYYGKTVTPKDGDKVLMRWKVSDNEYRVIFGDLHAETVTPEKLAELEAALPK